jgi:GNAT superfamily N-acetyltransferase
MFWQKDEFTITTDPGRLDIAYIHAWLSGRSYWAEGIPMATVRAAIDGSLPFGVYQGDRQIGFARVITDKATFGYLADVFIDEEYRGLGLSKWLMDTILAHPELQGFRNWLLLTLDAHGLYARSGFGPHAHPERIMIRTDPEIYKRALPTKE